MSCLDINKNGLWFVPVYLQLCILSPLLNKFLNRIAKPREFVYVLIILSFFTIYLGFIRRDEKFIGGTEIFHFIFLYVLGYFCRSHIAPNISNDYMKKMLALCFFLMFLVFLLKYTGHSLLMKIAGAFYSYNSPGMIFISLIVFLAFSRLKFKSNFINYLSASSFSIYLIGSNPRVSHTISKIAEYLYYNTNSNIILLAELISLAVIVCVMCIVIDKTIGKMVIYQISSKMTRLCEVVYDKVSEIYIRLLVRFNL